MPEPATQHAWPPAVGICGPSNSGKTLLLERLVPALARRGLRVAVVKHCTHGLDVDHPGKDSDRIFRAGADVLAAGPDEALLRIRRDHMPLSLCLEHLSEGHDVVLVEGYRGADIPRIRLGEPAPDDPGGEVLLSLPDGTGECDAAEDAVWRVVGRAHANLPVLALVLVGGRSARMGTHKALLELGGRTLIERVVAAAAPHAAEVLLAGDGPAPPALSTLRRLPDAPGAQGPLAALLSALRWRPGARWIALACDLALIEPAAVAWLLSQARPGADAILPVAREGGPCEPLFAVYEPAARRHLERAAARGEWAPRRALADARVLSPRPPAGIADAWTNVNTPQDWSDLRQRLAAR